MADLVDSVDPGARKSIAYALDPTTLTAGGTISVNGAVIDRLAAEFDQTNGILASVGALVTLEDTKTAIVTAKLQHGDAANLSDAVDFTNHSGVVFQTVADILTAVSPALVFRQGFKVSVDARGMKQYCRVVVSIVFSNSITDTGLVWGTVELTGGQQNEPSDQIALGAAA